MDLSVCVANNTKIHLASVEKLAKTTKLRPKRVYRALHAVRLFSFGLIQHSAGITEESIDFKPR